MKKIISLAVMLVSSMAFASVSVYDHAGVLTQAEQSALTADGSRWPFDLHVLTDTFPNPAALNTAVHRCVNGPNVVCIGIDPAHHKTNVHVGTAVGIPSSEFQSIASAGNSNFRMNDYFGGIEAIASRARDAAHTIINVPNSRNVVPYAAQPQIQVHIDNPVSTGMSTGWWLFLFVMIALVGVVVYFVRRAVKITSKVNSDMNDFRDEAFEMSSHNIETANMREFNEKLSAKATTSKPMMPVTAKVVPSIPTLPVQTKVVIQNVPVATQPTQTVVHNHYSNGTPGYNSGYNNTLTGSVATDILLASELSRPYNNPTPVVVEREIIRETSPDAGGNSSSWGSSNSSDDDAGGRSSSWGNNDSDSNSNNNSSWDNNSSSDNNTSDWGGSDSNSGGGDSGGGDGGW